MEEEYEITLRITFPDGHGIGPITYLKNLLDEDPVVTLEYIDGNALS